MDTPVPLDDFVQEVFSVPTRVYNDSGYGGGDKTEFSYSSGSTSEGNISNSSTSDASSDIIETFATNSSSSSSSRGPTVTAAFVDADDSASAEGVSASETSGDGCSEKNEISDTTTTSTCAIVSTAVDNDVSADVSADARASSAGASSTSASSANASSASTGNSASSISGDKSSDKIEMSNTCSSCSSSISCVNIASAGDFINVSVRSAGASSMSRASDNARVSASASANRLPSSIGCSTTSSHSESTCCQLLGGDEDVNQDSSGKFCDRVVLDKFNSCSSQVLIADDVSINRKMIKRCLEKLGLLCDEAKDGAEAVAMCSAKRYRLVRGGHFFK